MIRRTRQILLLALAILAPLSAWLIVDHVKERDALIEASRGRVRAAAGEGATGILATVEDVRARLTRLRATSGSRSPAELRESLRAEFPDAVILLTRDAESSHATPARTGLSPFRRSATSPLSLAWCEAVDGRHYLRVRLRTGWPDPGPGFATRVTIVAPGGRVLAEWCHADLERKPGEQDRRKLSSRGVKEAGSEGPPAVAMYRDLDDDEVIGAWHPIPGVGGVLVEEHCSMVLEPVRGALPWHFTLGLLILTILPLILLEIARRWPAASSLLRLYQFAKPYWAPILLIVLAMGLYAAGSGAQLVMIKYLVEDVLLTPDDAWAMLVLLCIVMLVVVVTMALGRFMKDYLSAKVTQSIINDIRCRVGGHLLTLSLGFFHRRRQGALLSRLTNDVGRCRKALRLIFGDIVQEPLMLAGAIAAGFATNWRLALMIFLAFPILVIPISHFGKRIKRYARKRQVKRAEVTDVMVQMLAGIRIVKAFRMEEHEEERLRKANNRLLRQSLKVARTTALSETLLEIFNQVGAVAVLLAGGYFVLNGHFDITVADLVTFSAILTRMYKPVKDLTKTYNKIQDSLPSIERVFEILDDRPDIRDRPDARPLGKPRSSIAFEKVSFSYGDEEVLHDISFEAPVGSILALVGPTGAGKSTLTDLVARYYDPASGRITIDGVNLADYTVDSLLGHVAVVTQEPFLFHSTIRENILYGRPDATQAEIEEAAKAAFVHEEILAQPEGYDTVVGDRGSRLSGGQRQRITIARAILKDADILILDEATSSLDSRSEGEVQHALANLMGGRTTFVVAHRLSTIRNADRILVLEHGRVVESGSHEDLVEKGGLYAELHKMQEGGAGENHE